MSQNIDYSPLFYFPKQAGAQIYASDNIYLRKDSLVIFTCGANDKSYKSRREQFLEYAAKYFKYGAFFRAEDAFPALKQGGDDLLTIENQLADYSDCVLIINESPGTLAELGAFASNDLIVQKLLVVNSKEYYGQTSFISLGPLAKIDKKSRFKQTMHVDFSSISVHFDHIIGRIEENIVRKRRQRVDLSDLSRLKSVEGGNKLMLLLLQDIINLYSPVTEDELLLVLKEMPHGGYIKYGIELSLLQATGMVKLLGRYLISSKECAKHNYDINIQEWLGLRKKIINYYARYDYKRLELLFERALETGG